MDTNSTYVETGKVAALIRKLFYTSHRRAAQMLDEMSENIAAETDMRARCGLIIGRANFAHLVMCQVRRDVSEDRIREAAAKV